MLHGEPGPASQPASAALGWVRGVSGLREFSAVPQAGWQDGPGQAAWNPASAPHPNSC